MKFSIWVFVTWAAKGSFEAIAANRLEYIFTGIIIGAGSKPVYFLMNFLVNRKFVKEKEKLQPETLAVEPAASSEIAGARNGKLVPLPAAAPPPHKTIEELVGFVYDGGDRPQRLESTHFFQKPINLIVYHHTAMHSDSPYEEITREFDRKGWLTGYHCIIFKDGTIRVLCRWDRFGNHAQGYNSHSLGVALHGNFETNPKVPFSNYKGQFGITQPTLEQVDSAARIAALWALLHNIALVFPAKTAANFPKGLVPHKDISQKACPGNNFPHEKFRGSVKHYAAAWKQDQTFMDALKDFREHPMVKV
jgi:N-acetyl-anhydromuramyl-L-alanine amidase AmpD